MSAPVIGTVVVGLVVGYLPRVARPKASRPPATEFDAVHIITPPDYPTGGGPVNPISRILTAIGLGDGHPLTRRDRPLWAAAAGLDDLGQLTAAWLDGSIASQPGYYGPCDVDEDDAPGLTDTLILLNQAGFVTHGSQAGYDGPGYDGAHWQQMAAVEGLAAPHTYDWLCDALTGTRFGVLAWPCKARPWHRAGAGVPVTFREGQAYTTFGSQVGEVTIAGELYDGCGTAAIAAACAATQVTVYDPEPGRNDLWPALAAAAARQLRRRAPVWGGGV
jgi:uncharacterized protein DUF6919